MTSGGEAAVEKREDDRRLAGDGDGDGGDGGAVVRRRRRRRLEDRSVVKRIVKYPWPGQGVVAVVAAAVAAVGLLPRPSLRNHLRGRTLLSFFK